MNDVACGGRWWSVYSDILLYSVVLCGSLTDCQDCMDMICLSCKALFLMELVSYRYANINR